MVKPGRGARGVQRCPRRPPLPPALAGSLFRGLQAVPADGRLARSGLSPALPPGPPSLPGCSPAPAALRCPPRPRAAHPPLCVRGSPYARCLRSVGRTPPLPLESGPGVRALPVPPRPRPPAPTRAEIHAPLSAGPAPGSRGRPASASGPRGRKCSVAMAKARRGARPCGAWRSAGLSDRWTGSDPSRAAAEGEARTSGACGAGEAGPPGGRRRTGPPGDGRPAAGRREAGPPERGGRASLGE